MRLLILIILLFSLPTLASKKVLVIFSYPSGSWNQNGKLGIEKAFKQLNVDVRVDSHIYDNVKVRKAKLIKEEVFKINPSKKSVKS